MAPLQVQASEPRLRASLQATAQGSTSLRRVAVETDWCAGEIERPATPWSSHGSWLNDSDHGAKVVIGDRDTTSAKRIAAQAEVHVIDLDSPSEAHWTRAVAEAVATYGVLDVLVNCSGIELVRSLSESSLEDWHRVMSVNLDGVFLGTRAAIAVMLRGASLVNISSVAGINGFSRQIACCASKGGVRPLFKSAAVECAEAGLGIRVNSIHPGIVDTPMAQDILGAVEPRMHSEIEAHWKQMQPIDRIGQASEVAQCILRLASDASSFVSGTELVVNGGLTAR